MFSSKAGFRRETMAKVMRAKPLTRDYFISRLWRKTSRQIKTVMTSDLSSFACRVREYVAICASELSSKRREDPDFQKQADAEFNGMARMLFMLQFHHNPAYKKICQARNISPDAVNHWTEIPATQNASSGTVTTVLGDSHLEYTAF